MKRFTYAFIAFLIIRVLSGNYNSYPQVSNFSDENQGGVLGFTKNNIEKFERTSHNVDSLLLKEYSGLPLKALQFRLIVGTKGKLIIKSVERGTGIPSSSFWFDYEIYKGKPQSDGSSTDTVVALFLGNGENVLMPGKVHHIVSIHYETASVDAEGMTTSLKLYNVKGATSAPVQDALITAGDDKEIYIKKSSANDMDISLLQNYPNPFNPITTIKYTIKSGEHVSLKIYNSLGEEVDVLTNEYKTPGTYESSFNADGLTSGVYLYRLQTSSFTETRKMLLLR